MIRLPNWQTRLSDYIVTTAKTPFKYGVADCGLFVAGAIQAMTGVDVAADLRGRYTNRKEAFASIKKLCGKPTMDAIAAYLAVENGFPEVPMAMAQRGDPVVLYSGPRSTLGIVAMHGTELLTPYKDGLLRLPLIHATKTYHVG